MVHINFQELTRVLRHGWIFFLKFQIPTRYDNFSNGLVNMICDADQFFTQLHAKADRMDSNLGHFHKVVDDKIKECWIYCDSQQIAENMKDV
jgi:hypothetical protein